MASQITFIGAGNMARSLISGLLAAGHPADALCATDPLAQQRDALSEQGIPVSADNASAAARADLIVLAVKPQVLRTVLTSLSPLRADQLLISIAAGVGMKSLEAWSSPDQPIVRCMPNTPALLGAGITALHANASVSPEQRRQAEAVLSAAGKTLWVTSDSELDAVTAVSGSGPAYFFYLMEGMIAAGEALGLDETTARLLTLETAYGAALMARDGATPPAQLRSNVTSPGGTTERALSLLDAAGVREAIEAAVQGAAKRSKELAEEFGES